MGQNKYAHFSKKVKPERLPVWVDQISQRKKLIKECQKYLKKLSDAKESVTQYQEKDLKNFAAWVEGVFASSMDDYSQVRSEFDRLRRLMSDVQREARRRRCSLKEAYQYVKRGDTKSECDHSDFEFGNNDRENPPDRDSMLHELFEDFFGAREHWKGRSQDFDAMFEDFKRDFAFNQKRATRESEAQSTQSTTRKDDLEKKQRDLHLLKIIYRRLAQALHPDLNSNLDERKKEFWVEMQSAYKERDLERLMALEALLKIDEGRLAPDEAETSVLSQLLMDVKSKFKKVQTDVRRFKKSPEWGFSEALKTRSKMKIIHQEVQWQIQTEGQEMISELQGMKNLVKQWETPERKTRRKSSRSRNHLDEMSLFEFMGP